jgi:hypothetical protein
MCKFINVLTGEAILKDSLFFLCCMDKFLRLRPLDIRLFKQNYRRDAMLRVFSPIGFDLIVTPNTRF